MRTQCMPVVAALVASLAATAFAGAYEIGEELESEAFWKSDPVLFVRKHADSGFELSSEQRDGADSRQDGGVTCFGLPVYESRISFGQAGGIERVELMLYTRGGTETMREFVGADGKKFRRRERVEKSMSSEDFAAVLNAVRKRLTASGAKQPAVVKESVGGGKQRSQTWPKTSLPTQATLTWNYEQEGKSAQTFRAGFIRLAVNGPARLAAGSSGKGVKKPVVAKSAKKITDNVIDESKGRGDVFVDNVPMVDQGQKGYCAAAASERVLRYYGVDVDEHEIAQAAGTTAEGGTSTLGMKNSVQAIGRRYKLGTVVTYGDFEKPVAERIEGIVKEVANYNKAAKKLKKKEIAEDVYVTRSGTTTYYDPAAADAAMDPEVLKYMKTEGPQRSKFTKFLKDVHDQVNKGIPLIWGVVLGTYPEPEIPQSSGGHMRLIIGYNDKRKEILYTDSWGAGHELKRMPAEWAWTISHCVMYLKPLR